MPTCLPYSYLYDAHDITPNAVPMEVRMVINV